MKACHKIFLLVCCSFFFVSGCGKTKDEKSSVSKDPYEQLKRCSEDQFKLLTQLGAHSDSFEKLPDSGPGSEDPQFNKKNITDQFEADLKNLKDNYRIDSKDDHCYFRLDKASAKLNLSKDQNHLYDQSLLNDLEGRLSEMKK